MSRIDNLVAELCPEGVEFKPLGDLLNYEQPGKYLVASKDYDASFETPVLTAGQTFILGYTSETDGIYAATPTAPVVIFDDFTTAFKWVDFDFKAKSSAMKMLTPKPGVNMRYVWFAMQAIKYKPQDHSRQWISTYSKIRVPVPPPLIQQEIVEILDTMEVLQTELKSLLESELELRSHQYAHYRDALIGDSVPESEWKPLSRVGPLVRGRRFTKAHYVEDGIPAIHYGHIYTDFGPSTTTVRAHVRKEMEGALRYANHGDVIIAGVSETVEDVGKAVAWLGDGSVAYHDDSFRLTHEMDARFVSYALQTAFFHEQKERHVSRGKMKRLSAEGLGQIRIPVPHRDEQKRVAEILDSFDALVKDLSSNLPTEVEARRQQYEHYRDRLLTFKEKDVVA